jgi:kinesin family protein 3/17
MTKLFPLYGKHRTTLYATLTYSSASLFVSQPAILPHFYSRYANRAKRIKNIPVINEDPKDAMLREYQEEIAKLRAQVERIDIVYHPNEESAQSKSSSMTTLLRDVALQDFKEHAAKERADLMAQSEEERANIQTERKHSKEEKRALEEKLEIESRTREEIDMQRLNLQKKLQDMEAQLIIGGDLTNEAAKQEAELRKAQQDLIAKQEAEIASSRQMMEKEEANLNLTEQYSSLQEACQSITKKLKKLWKKYQQAKAEIEDLNKEFQIERTDMLGTIRDLNKHTMRKDMIIDNFIPPEVRSYSQSPILRHLVHNTLIVFTHTYPVMHLKHVTKFNDESQGGLASWDESEEKWIIARLDLAGNNFVKAIPTSVVGAFRPETDYSRCRQQLGGDRRHCHENILSLDLDYVSKATENSIDNTADANIIKKRIDDDSDSSHTNKGKTPYLWFTKEKKQGKVKRDHGVHRPRTAYH